jgi:small subunit ribosomal protein S6
LKDSKRAFETTFIVNASLDDSLIEGVIAKVQDLLTKNQGEVTEVQRWGRKRLAYPIAKKNNGFYVCIEFTGPVDLVTKLARFYHLEDNILRYLTIQVTEQMLKARLASPAPAGNIPEQPPTTAEPEKAPPVVQENESKLPQTQVEN